MPSRQTRTWPNRRAHRKANQTAKLWPLQVHTLDPQKRHAAACPEELMPFLEGPPRKLLVRTDAVETLAERAGVLVVRNLGACANVNGVVAADVGSQPHGSETSQETVELLSKARNFIAQHLDSLLQGGRSCHRVFAFVHLTARTGAFQVGFYSVECPIDDFESDTRLIVEVHLIALLSKVKAYSYAALVRRGPSSPLLNRFLS